MTEDVAGLADLHMHTVASDGMCEAGELLERAKRAGLRALAITDHDTVAVHLRGGFPADGPEVISGIELSCDTKWGELHVLGYHLDVRHPPLLERLEQLRLNRVKRLGRIVAALQIAGVELEPSFVADLEQRPGSIGRPHVAREMIRVGAVGSFREAFDRYLGSRGSAYIPHHNGLTPQDAISLITGAGGVASVAHPGKLLEAAPEDFMRGLAEAGLEAIETHHPSHYPNQIKNCHRLAEELGLIETGGSDFHSDSDASEPGGTGRHCGVGGSTVGYAVVARMRALGRRRETCEASKR